MVEESGTVVRIDGDALWVETLRQSTCGTCRARSGCGQRALAGVLQTTSTLRVPLDGRSPGAFAIGEAVTIGIPDHVIALGSLGVYLVPLLGFLGAAAVATGAGLGEGWVILAAALGLVLGGALVRGLSWRARNHPDLQPRLIDTSPSPAVTVFP